MKTNRVRTAAVGLAILFGTVAAQAAPGAADETAQAINRLTSNNAQERADAAARLRELGTDAQAAIPALIKLLGDQTPTRAANDDARAPDGRLSPSPGLEAAKALAQMRSTVAGISSRTALTSES